MAHNCPLWSVDYECRPHRKLSTMPHVLFDEGYPDQMVPGGGVSRNQRFFLGHTERICILSSCLTRPTNRPAGDARMSEEPNEFVTNRVAAEIS